MKQRIRAIKNIGKITKAMKMVAASKMRSAQVAVETSRGIVDPFLRLFGDHPGAYMHPWLLPGSSRGLNLSLVLPFCSFACQQAGDCGSHVGQGSLRRPEL